MRYSYIIFLSVMLFLALPIYNARPLNEVYIPFAPYHVEPINKILYPRLAAPIFLRPGDNITVYLSGSIEVRSLYAFDNIRGFNYSIDVIDVESIVDNREGAVIKDITKITGRLPDDIRSSLYDLVVFSGSSVFREPNSLMVVPMYKDRIVIGHISDPHLGGWGGKYIEAYENFDKAIYSLESMGVDIIVCSGDFIEQNKEQGIQHIYSLLSNLAVPFTTTLGNTDYSFNSKGLYLIEKYFAPDSSMVYLGKGIIVNIDAETGDIAEDVVYEWIRDTLVNYRDLRLKIMNSHYPNWDPDVVSNKFIQFFKNMNDEFGISLFLHGHIHRNSKRVSDTTGILSITTTSTELSKEFLGFRLIYGFSNGSIIANDDMIFNLEKFYVDYSQDNFYTSTGQTAIVTNDLDYDVNLTLFFKILDNGGELRINDSTVSNNVYQVSDGNRLKTVIYNVSVPKKSKMVYVLSQGVDNSPPNATIKVGTFKQYYYLRINAVDEGTGIAHIDVFYSTDNSSWTPCKYIIIDSWPYPTIPRDLAGFYYKVVLSDYSGNSNTIYGTYGSLGGSTPPPSAGPNLDLSLIIGVIAAIIIVVVIAILVKVRK